MFLLTVMDDEFNSWTKQEFLVAVCSHTVQDGRAKTMNIFQFQCLQILEKYTFLYILLKYSDKKLSLSLSSLIKTLES